jgi:GTP-binding protein
MFVDRAVIHVRSGKGGDGCAHLLQLKGNPKGGPDGGDGGKGGDVVVVGDPHLDTLVEFAYKPHWFAKDGENGQKKKCHGCDGTDIEIRLPLGAQVIDPESGDIVADILEPGQRVVIAAGGRGGLGNDHFKSAVHQTPLERTLGEPSVEKTYEVELKLIADVGFVGLPNAGKSTLLKASTRANPKVADYPFTTLGPQLGILDLGDERRLVLADLPGLIEGAAEGAGLGHDFLRHVERTRCILHVVDALPVDGSDPVESYRTIRRELAEFSDELARKPELVVLNKIDLLPAEDRAELLADVLERFAKRGVKPMMMSGATGEGVRDVMLSVWRMAEAARARV